MLYFRDIRNILGQMTENFRPTHFIEMHAVDMQGYILHSLKVYQSSYRQTKKNWRITQKYVIVVISEYIVPQLNRPNFLYKGPHLYTRFRQHFMNQLLFVLHIHVKNYVLTIHKNAADNSVIGTRQTLSN